MDVSDAETIGEVQDQLSRYFVTCMSVGLTLSGAFVGVVTRDSFQRVGGCSRRPADQPRWGQPEAWNCLVYRLNMCF
jgi:hypothetical protein